MTFGAGGTPLPAQAVMWPTPSSSLVQDGESPETWLARREALKAKGINGNGAGMPLTIASALWPTIMVSDVTRGSGTYKRGNPTLKGAMRAWQTPRVLDAAGVAYQRAAGKVGAEYLTTSGQARTWAGEKIVFSPGRQAQMTLKAGSHTSHDIRVLSPRFVEVLMGWPSGWSDCAPSEMVSYPSKRPSPGAFSILDFF